MCCDILDSVSAVFNGLKVYLALINMLTIWRLCSQGANVARDPFMCGEKQKEITDTQNAVLTHSMHP